jgi:hypothetical protein
LFTDVSKKVIDILNYIIEKEKYIIPSDQEYIFVRKDKDINIVKYLENFTKESKKNYAKTLKDL